jgi:hypothetical protein
MGESRRFPRYRVLVMLCFDKKWMKSKEFNIMMKIETFYLHFRRMCYVMGAACGAYG